MDDDGDIKLKGAGVDYVEPKNVSIPMRVFAEFMSFSGRSLTCPGCKYHGPWVMHGHNQEGAEPIVKIYTFTGKTEPGSNFPVILMECPQCGFVQSTSAIRVLSFMRERENGEQG